MPELIPARCENAPIGGWYFYPHLRSDANLVREHAEPHIGVAEGACPYPDSPDSLSVLAAEEESSTELLGRTLGLLSELAPVEEPHAIDPSGKQQLPSPAWSEAEGKAISICPLSEREVLQDARVRIIADGVTGEDLPLWIPGAMCPPPVCLPTESQNIESMVPCAPQRVEEHRVTPLKFKSCPNARPWTPGAAVLDESSTVLFVAVIAVLRAGGVVAQDPQESRECECIARRESEICPG
jgi:hypothetical protein